MGRIIGYVSKYSAMDEIKKSFVVMNGGQGGGTSAGVVGTPPVKSLQPSRQTQNRNDSGVKDTELAMKLLESSMQNNRNS